jgi:type II secretory pathway predicted ATPase ExeA
MSDLQVNNLLVARVLAGRAFLVKTDSGVQYYLRLKRWLATGNQGAVIYGRPRLGKTSATRWVLGMIQQTYGKVPFVEVPIRTQHLQNEGAFFQFLSKCCRHKHYKKGTVADKRDRLLESLLGRARRSSIRMVILFIDEAQDLEELHYQWLRNISNELDMAGCRLFCLLVGQPELADKRQSLLAEGLEQIVGRFMTESWGFSGLRNSLQLKEVLIGFDNAFYPKVDGKPFVSYFIPQAFEHGFRLEGVSDQLWDEFQKRWNELLIDRPIEIGMQYVASAITILLNDASAHDRLDFSVDQTKIIKCIERSGFVDAMKVLNSVPVHTLKKRKNKFL